VSSLSVLYGIPTEFSRNSFELCRLFVPKLRLRNKREILVEKAVVQLWSEGPIQSTRDLSSKRKWEYKPRMHAAIIDKDGDRLFLIKGKHLKRKCGLSQSFSLSCLMLNFILLC
jgi:hypothetical protein